MTTFSRYLFRALLPGFFITLLGSGLLIKTLIGKSLINEFDQGLASKAQALMAITEQDEDEIELEIYSAALSGYFKEIDPDYFDIRNSEGKRLFHSDSIAADRPLVRNPSTEDGFISDIVLPDGRDGRYIHRTYYPRIDIDDGEEMPHTADNLAGITVSAPHDTSKTPAIVEPELVTVTVAVSRTDLDAGLTQLNTILILTGLLTTAVLILLQRNAVQRAVRPIENISEQISNLDVDQMDYNLTLSKPIQELNVLTTRFNDLMSRLRQGFKRERQFSADLAHEIRTPLAELRSLIEVMNRFPDDQNLKASFNQDTLISVDRIERLVTSLQALSRGELGLINPSGSLELNSLVAHMFQLSQHAMEKNGLELNLTMTTSPIGVKGVDQWPSILENLIDNIVEYSPVNSIIQVILTNNDTLGTFDLTMENEAPELTTTNIPHLFDRLWRKNSARTSARHSGLGLSLVRMYTAVVGANIEAQLVPTNRLRITISGSIEEKQTKSK